jgi:L-threonylcarbamoyladenylate synthase
MTTVFDDGTRQRTIECLLAGGIVLLPTDTVYGLAVHPVHGADAVQRLYRMKRRPGGLKLPVMVSSIDQIEPIGAYVTDEARRLFAAYSPGPLTVALGLDETRTPPWLAGRDEFGVRIPADAFILSVLDETGPLFVTSANLHAQETPEAFDDVLTGLDGEPDLALDGGVRATVPSTLVNCNLPVPVVERVGAVPAEQIAKVLA